MSTKLQFTGEVFGGKLARAFTDPVAVVKAINLPKALVGKPKYYASVQVDTQAPLNTKEIKGENPIWYETVVL